MRPGSTKGCCKHVAPTNSQCVLASNNQHARLQIEGHWRFGATLAKVLDFAPNDRWGAKPITWLYFAPSKQAQ